MIRISYLAHLLTLVSLLSQVMLILSIGFLTQLDRPLLAFSRMGITAYDQPIDLQKLNEIQYLIDNGWSIEDDVLLMSLEFLYSDNYRMAVFNAATLLELVLLKFWELKFSQLQSGSQQEQEKVAHLERELKKSNYTTQVEKILRIVIPEFINPNFINDGSLERCVIAWNIRNEKLGHLYMQVKEGNEPRIRQMKLGTRSRAYLHFLLKLKTAR